MTANSDKYILSIDLGTSGSKAALISVYGEVVDFDFESVPLILLPDGGAEQKPDDWWQAIMTTSKRLLSKGTVNPDDIIAIVASTQWAGTVAVDRDDKPLMNAIIWLDMRGAKYVAQMAGGPIKIEGYDPFKLLRWIRLTCGPRSPANSSSASRPGLTSTASAAGCLTRRSCARCPTRRA